MRYYSEKHTSLVVFGDVISFDMFLFLVGGFYVSTPLKNISELGLLFPIYGKIKVMFQTTNQIVYVILNKM